MSDLERPLLGGWFARDADGNEITRERTCECGRQFTQRVMGERFMRMVERQGQGAVNAMLRDVPDLHVPVLCPPCESKALDARPSVDTWMIPIRRRMEDRERFARNMAQLCAAWNKPMDDETSQVYWRALERAVTDDEFERGVIGAVRSERKWPTPSVIAQHARAA